MKVIIVVMGVVLGVYVATAFELFVVNRGQAPIHADAVVVLAGTPERLPKGLELMSRGFAPILVVSLSRPTSHQQAAVCDAPIRIRVICFRARPFETRGEAREIGQLARTHGWTRIDVVTSSYHIVRARTLIDRCYHGSLRMISVSEPLSSLLPAILRESVKLLYQETVVRTC